MKRHAYRVHLPYYWHPDKACFQCELAVESKGHLIECHTSQQDHPVGCQFGSISEYHSRVLGYLQSIAQFIVGSPSLDLLLDKVIKEQWYLASKPNGVIFDEIEVALVRTLQNTLGEYNLPMAVSPPSGKACLIHWRIVCHLLSNITEEQLKQLQSADTRATITPEPD